MLLQSAGLDSRQCSWLYKAMLKYKTPDPSPISLLVMQKLLCTSWKNGSYDNFDISSLPFSLSFVLQHLKENFARVQACISELRSLPREGCFPQGGNGVVQAVQDGLQQFKQYSRHTAAGGSANSSVEVRQHWEDGGDFPFSLSWDG